jgi:predicted nucleic-acid-binding Zn-ribbon protein
MANYDVKALIEHLNEKWGVRGCAQCGSTNWELQDSIFELRQFRGGTLVVDGPLIPVVPVVCRNCGNTVLVNGLIARVVTRPEEVKK